MRYVDFMEINGGREIANYSLDRATQIFVKVFFLKPWISHAYNLKVLCFIFHYEFSQQHFIVIQDACTKIFTE